MKMSSEGGKIKAELVVCLTKTWFRGQARAGDGLSMKEPELISIPRGSRFCSLSHM